MKCCDSVVIASVRCVVCVCCNFVLEWLRSGFVVLLRCGYFIVEYVSSRLCL